MVISILFLSLGAAPDAPGGARFRVMVIAVTRSAAAEQLPRRIAAVPMVAGAIPSLAAMRWHRSYARGVIEISSAENRCIVA
jgi:hypothetical protein